MPVKRLFLLIFALMIGLLLGQPAGADLTVDPEEIDDALEPEFERHIEIVVTNDGNEAVDYSVERRLTEGPDAEPGELLAEHIIGDEVDDRFMHGVVYVNGRFYVSGGNGGADDNSIHIFDEDGNHIEDFPQFNESRHGMYDLTWDGELIWGGDGRTVYGFTTDGELQAEFDVFPINPANALAWDEDRNILWVTSTLRADLIVGFDRNGDQIAQIEKDEDFLINGMSYYPDDPDGYTLYIFSEEGDGDSDTWVYKLNPDDGDIELVADIGLEDLDAGGVHITADYDVHSWVFIGICEALGRNPDVLNIWQIGPRIGWMQINPEGGVIEADGSETLELSLSSFGIPIETVFEGELFFTYDESELSLPVTMEVTDQPVQTERTLNFHLGWNMVSLNLQPNEDDVEAMMVPLVDAGVLMLVKDGAGNFYSPANEHNDIPGWSVDEGYLVKVNTRSTLAIEGLSSVPDAVISLEAGWRLVSYYPRIPVEATLALSGIVDDLVIVKDERGHFYIPEFDFSNMDPMQEGTGYQMNLENDVDLIYVTEEDQGDRVASVRRQTATTPAYLPTLPATGANMSLLVTSDIDGDVGVYVSDRLVGSGRLENGIGGMAVWGDDPTTAEIDGALDGESLEIRLFDGSEAPRMTLTILKGDPVYRTNGFLAVRLDGATSVPESFGIVSAYPNPFNAITRVNYSLPEEAMVDLAVYDIAGRQVRRLVSGHRQAGSHEITINADDLPSGIYVIRLEAAGQLSQWKVALVK